MMAADRHGGDPPTSHSYRGYVGQPRHSAECTGMPSSCECVGARELWALAPDDVALPAPGKWMLFPESQRKADAAWGAVADATARGQLGFAAKASFLDRAKPAIMVYTADHTDRRDVNAVRNAIQAAVDAAGVRGLDMSYKSDAATDEGRYSMRAPGAARGASEVWDGPVSMLVAPAAHRPACKFFGSRMGCKFGDTCKFRHDDY
jgi:hypothetical protein